MWAPKPVHPRPSRQHGLIGLTYVRQHMFSDERWSPSCLMEQLSGMAELLTKQLVFTKLETKASQKKIIRECRFLKQQCRDGYSKLANVLRNNNSYMVRNYLINHKDMQRLYQKMPLYMVLDNINQRTFVMRKERDRLQYRMNQLKAEYRKILLRRAVVENRIKYQNEFVLETELKAHYFRKKIENSVVRLKAIKTVHNTYKRMIHVLQHDCIFYEPILRSLNKDIQDQATFIRHILCLGKPAIAKFGILSEDYRRMEERSRRNLASKLANMAQYRIVKESGSRVKLNNDEDETSTDVIFHHQHYARETASMQRLKDQLEIIEKTIKQVKVSTLCSQAMEIYPRFKRKVENNFKLKKAVKCDQWSLRSIDTRTKRANVLAGVLVNNLTEDEIKRKQRIKNLQLAIEQQEEHEKDLTDYIKNRGDACVLLRRALWNLNEILEYVDRPQRVAHTTYPSAYLKLPLLKFNMLTMRAVPPEPYEQKVEKLMVNVKRKVGKLMYIIEGNLTDFILMPYRDDYQELFFESQEQVKATENNDETARTIEDDLPETKLLCIPNRRQIKLNSARVVEELSRRSES